MQDVAKEVLAFAEMTSDAPVAPQPDAYDFPDIPPGPVYDAFGGGSPVLSALPNGTVSPYRCAAVITRGLHRRRCQRSC